MVKGIFKVIENPDSSTKWSIKTINLLDVPNSDAVERAKGKELDMPSIIIESLKTRYTTGEERLKKIDTIIAVLSGVTFSLNVESADLFDRNSVLISFEFKPGMEDDPEPIITANWVIGAFKIEKDSSKSTGYGLKVINLFGIDDTGLVDKVLELPKVVLEDLKGKRLTGPLMIRRIKLITLKLCGITEQLEVEKSILYHEHSEIVSFTISPISGSIDEEFDVNKEFKSVQDYEQYHIIKMKRDITGNDGTIHAYLVTPKDGELRCIFDKSVRTYAKRNNIDYWVEYYKIEEGSSGGKFVRPMTTPEEIIV